MCFTSRSFTTIGSGALLDASARMGNAGSVVVWSNGDTLFEGEARAQALGSIGNTPSSSGSGGSGGSGGFGGGGGGGGGGGAGGGY